MLVHPTLRGGLDQLILEKIGLNLATPTWNLEARDRVKRKSNLSEEEKRIERSAYQISFRALCTWCNVTCHVTWS